MDKTKRKRNLIFGIIFLILLFVLTYFIIFRKIELGKVYDIIKSADWRFIFAAFSMIIVYFVLYGFFCRETLRFKGVKTGMLKGIVYGCADFYFSAITPSATGG